MAPGGIAMTLMSRLGCRVPTFMPGIFGFGSADLWVVGDEGLVLRFDGTEWSRETIGDDTLRLSAVWGTSPTNMYVGSSGSLFHFDGTSWAEIAEIENVRQITGSGPDDIYVVGRFNSFFHHFDGTEWSEIEPNTGNVSAVWAAGPGDVWIATSRTSPPPFSDGTTEVGFVHLTDAGSFTTWLGDDSSVYEMWGSGPADIWAMSNTSAYHYDGVTWESTPWEQDQTSTVWGRGPDDIFALGAKTLRFDGQSWSPIDSGPRRGTAVTGHSSSDIYVMAQNELAQNEHWHFDGEAWAQIDALPTSSQVVSHLAVSDGLVALVSGDTRDSLVHFDGDRWEELPYLVGTPAQARLIWGTDSASLIMISSLEDVSHHFDGNEWSQVPCDLGHSTTAIWGSSMDDVFAVGQMYDGRAAVSHFDGTGWEPMDAPDGSLGPLRAVWGSGPTDVYAVGERMGEARALGFVLHYDGTSWSSIDIGTAPMLYAVWVGAPDDVYVGGFGGTIVHYDGERWASMDSGTDEEILDLWGSSEDGIVVAGARSGVLQLTL